MTDDRKPFHNPFAALRGLAGLPEPPAEAPAPPAELRATRPKPSTASPKSAKIPASDLATNAAGTIPRAVVRLERSGRGGKEVTVIEHLEIGSQEREQWLKALKSGLGCGGVIEDASIVLQGDQRDRVAKLLTARGVKKVVRG